MNEGDSSWSLGVLLGLPTAILGFLGLFLAYRIIKHYIPRADNYDKGMLKFISRAVLVVMVLQVVLTTWAFYPWKAEYHQFVTKVGTVESIESRILGSSDAFQQKFVVRFTDGRQFGCEDTRCALVKPGNILTITCKRQWQYAGVDGYDCKFIRNEIA